MHADVRDKPRSKQSEKMFAPFEKKQAWRTFHALDQTKHAAEKAVSDARTVHITEREERRSSYLLLQRERSGGAPVSHARRNA